MRRSFYQGSVVTTNQISEVPLFGLPRRLLLSVFALTLTLQTVSPIVLMADASTPVSRTELLLQDLAQSGSSSASNSVIPASVTPLPESDLKLAFRKKKSVAESSNNTALPVVSESILMPETTQSVETSPGEAKVLRQIKGVSEIRLPSGQMLYVKEDHTKPVVTIDTWVKTGSVNETAENNGVSHFLEHLLFKGTERFKQGEIDRLIESKGATFNAATSDDFTHYHITLSPEFLEQALDVHADMLLNSIIPEDELTLERKVVQEEINRAADKPYYNLFLAIGDGLFKGHGYAWDTLGPKSNIETIPRTDILNYYHHWYQPDKMNTVIVGDVSTEKVMALVQKAFVFKPSQTTPSATESFVQSSSVQSHDSNHENGPIDLLMAKPKKHDRSEKKAELKAAMDSTSVNSYTPPVVLPVTQVKSLQVKVIEDPNISQCYLGLAFLGPRIDDRKTATALDVAMQVLGSGKSSRLYQTLKEDLNTVTSVSGGNWTQQYAGLVYILAETPPEKLVKAQESLLQVLNEQRQKGITPAELVKTKTQTIKDFIYLNESTSGVANSIGYNVTIGNLEDYAHYVDWVQDVTLEEANEALRQYTDLSKAVLVQVVPKGHYPDLASAEAQLSQSVLAAAQSPHFTEVAGASVDNQEALSQTISDQNNSKTADATSAIEKTVLPNGMNVILKQRPDSETVAINLFVKGGKAVEPVPGVATIVSELMEKGTFTRSKEVINRELEARGMSLSVSAANDYILISAQCVADDLGELFLLLQDVVSQPALDDAEFNRVKGNLKEVIQASYDEPSTIALENLTMNLYPTHPYGNVGKRIEPHLKLINSGHVVDYFDSYFVPDNMVVSVVGRFDPDAVKHYLDAALPVVVNERSSLPKGPKGHQVDWPTKPVLKSAKTINASKDKQSATWIAQGWLGPEAKSPDYAAFKVLNSLLGTGMSSRLFVNLREKQGLAYAVSSFLPTDRDRSRFVLYIGTAPENQTRVTEGFQKEIEALKLTPASAEEIQEAKDKLTGAFALAHETNENQAFYLGFYETIGLGYGFDHTYPAWVQSVTAADVQRVAQQYLSQPSVLSIVAPVAIPAQHADSAKAPPAAKAPQ